MSVRLPPNYVIVPAALVYSDLPASIQRTAARIYGLAWQAHRQAGLNEPLTVTIELDDLMDVCDLSRRQLFAHLRVLVKRAVLRYRYSKSVGIYVFSLPPRSAWSSVGEKSADFRTDPTIGVVDVPSDGVTASHANQQQHSSHAVGGGCEGGDGECGEPHCAGILEAMGVAEPTRSELLRLDWTNGPYLTEWQEWLQSQGAMGVGWVITQIRAGAEPPATRQVSAQAERQRYLEWGGQR